MSRFRAMRATVLVALTAGFISGAFPAYPSEPADIMSKLDYGVCEPVRFKATVMEVDRPKGRLLVAEKWVYALYVGIDGPKQKTELLNAEGKPEPFGQFKVGDRVSVIGFAHPDGFVVAAKIRKVRASADHQSKAKRLKSGQPHQD